MLIPFFCTYFTNHFRRFSSMRWFICSATPLYRGYQVSAMFTLAVIALSHIFSIGSKIFIHWFREDPIHTNGCGSQSCTTCHSGLSTSFNMNYGGSLKNFFFQAWTIGFSDFHTFQTVVNHTVLIALDA